VCIFIQSPAVQESDAFQFLEQQFNQELEMQDMILLHGVMLELVMHLVSILFKTVKLQV